MSIVIFSATVAIASTVQIECASESIIVHISTEGNTDFHGLVYPRGLSKNSSCLQEYRSQPAPITYNLPLRSCNTMPTELVSFSLYKSLHLCHWDTLYMRTYISSYSNSISSYLCLSLVFLIANIFLPSCLRADRQRRKLSCASQLDYYPLS